MGYRILAGTAVAAVGALLAGCATRQPVAPVVVIAPAPAYAPVARPPGGAAANLTIPPRRADGNYLTPNQGLSASAALWHLRVALNVAALGCRGPLEPLLVASYNQWLRSRSVALAAAERTLITEYRRGAGESGRVAYDGAMTKLYNYFAQPPVQAGFCAAAAKVAGEIATVPAAGLADYAAQMVPALDAPFVEFYRAYDAWRDARDHLAAMPYLRPGPSIAVAAATPIGGARAPRIAVDPAIFKMP